MSDVNQAPAGSEVVAEESFDDNFAAFLDHDFSAGNENDGDLNEAGNDTAASDTNSGSDTLAGSTESSGANANDTLAAPAEGSLTPTPETSGADSVLGVDPADLAAMIGLATVPAPAGAATTVGTEPAAPAAASEGDDAFAPFQPTFRLPPALTSALFEAEDTETREKALVGLLSSFGNTITSVVIEHVRKGVLPAYTQEASERSQHQTAAQAVHTDFYGEFPELAAYVPAVRQAFQVVHAKSNGAPYTEEMRNQVGLLARAAIENAGVKLPPRKGAVAPAPAAPVVVTKPTKANVFEAGNGRPGGGNINMDSGPADLVAQLTEF